MDKYIGFDIDDKKTVACVVQKGKKDLYDTMLTDIKEMRYWLKEQRKPGDKLHLTFEVSGVAGWLYDNLIDSVDTLTVSNPSKMTWIFRTSKKTDRIDARKQAVLLQLGEIPKVHMPPCCPNLPTRPHSKLWFSTDFLTRITMWKDAKIIYKYC